MGQCYSKKNRKSDYLLEPTVKNCESLIKSLNRQPYNIKQKNIAFQIQNYLQSSALLKLNDISNRKLSSHLNFLFQDIDFLDLRIYVAKSILNNMLAYNSDNAQKIKFLEQIISCLKQILEEHVIKLEKIENKNFSNDQLPNQFLQIMINIYAYFKLNNKYQIDKKILQNIGSDVIQFVGKIKYEYYVQKKEILHLNKYYFGPINQDEETQIQKRIQQISVSTQYLSELYIQSISFINKNQNLMFSQEIQIPQV